MRVRGEEEDAAVAVAAVVDGLDGFDLLVDGSVRRRLAPLAISVSGGSSVVEQVSHAALLGHTDNILTSLPIDGRRQ